MRAPWVLAAVLTAVSPSTRAGVWDPPPVACEGTDEVAPGSSMEAWGLLDDCLVETEAQAQDPSVGWARDCRCAALARWLILWGDRSDLERAWRLYDELADDHTLGLRVLDSMLDRVVADAIEKWERGAVEEEVAACPGEDTAPPLPTELRRAPHALREAAHLFVGIRHASSVEAGLRALGDDVPDARPTPPVKLRIVVDGRGLAAHRIEWLHHGSGAGETDALGVLRLDRDPFLDAHLPRVVTLETPS